MPTVASQAAWGRCTAVNCRSPRLKVERQPPGPANEYSRLDSDERRKPRPNPARLFLRGGCQFRMPNLPIRLKYTLVSKLGEITPCPRNIQIVRRIVAAQQAILQQPVPFLLPLVENGLR